MKRLYENWRTFLVEKPIPAQTLDSPADLAPEPPTTDTEPGGSGPPTMVWGPSNGTGPCVTWGCKRKLARKGKKFFHRPYGMLVNGVELGDSSRWIRLDKKNRRANDTAYGDRFYATPELIRVIKAGFDRVYQKSDSWYAKALILDIVDPYLGELPPQMDTPKAMKIFKLLKGEKIKGMPDLSETYNIIRAMGLLRSKTGPLAVEDLSPAPNKTDEYGNRYLNPIETKGHGSHQTGEDADLAYYMLPGRAATQKTKFVKPKMAHTRNPLVNPKTGQRGDDPMAGIKEFYEKRWVASLEKPSKPYSDPSPWRSIGAFATDEKGWPSIPPNSPCDDVLKADACAPNEVCLNGFCYPVLSNKKKIASLELEIKRKKEEIERNLDHLIDLTSKPVPEIQATSKEVAKLENDLYNLKVISIRQPGPWRQEPIDTNDAKAREKLRDEMRNLFYNKLFGDFDAHRTWQFISGMLSTGLVKQIYIDGGLHGHLRRAAHIAGDKYPTGRIIYHVKNHLSHMHVRITAAKSRERGKAFLRKNRSSGLVKVYNKHQVRTAKARRAHADRFRRPSPAPRTPTK